jgi:uracil-DNA glycosylase family protein
MPTAPAPHQRIARENQWRRAPVDPDQHEGAEARTIPELRGAAGHCRRCPLFRNATQTVFGEGPEEARILFVGEQPGDQEDLAGKPFVGPAGRMLDAVLQEAGVDRSIIYVTNAVKHFKFEPRGKRRIHAKPNASEISACRWWLDKELDLVKPDIAVALGATAAQSLLGKAVPVMKMRGRIVTREDRLRVFITVHPSYLLRIREGADKRAERTRFLEDMRKMNKLMAGQ